MALLSMLWLMAVPQVLLKIAGMQDLVEALLSYTQRHFVRMDRLVRSTFLLDYTLTSMNVLMPSVGTDGLGPPAVEQLEAPGTDVDESSGTDVDTDAFMQPPLAVQADDEHEAGSGEQQQQAVNVSPGQQEDVEEVQEKEAHGAQEGHQSKPQNSKSAKVSGAKRRKSAPQPVKTNAAAPKAGSQTAVKVKRKKLT